MRRTKEDAELTRKAILASAMDIFYEKGYSKTTFDEIAKRINLTKGAVYWYFRNKPDIVAAIINEFLSEHMNELEQFIVDKDSVDFQDIIDMELYNNKCIREDKNVYKFIFFLTCQMEWSEAIITKIAPLIKKTKEFSRGLIANALKQMQENNKIKPDIDVNMITEILLTMYLGMMEGYLSKRSVYDFDTLVTNGFNLIFDNIKMEGKHNED